MSPLFPHSWAHSLLFSHALRQLSLHLIERLTRGPSKSYTISWLSIPPNIKNLPTPLHFFYSTTNYCMLSIEPNTQPCNTTGALKRARNPETNESAHEHQSHKMRTMMTSTSPTPHLLTPLQPRIAILIPQLHRRHKLPCHRQPVCKGIRESSGIRSTST